MTRLSEMEILTGQTGVDELVKFTIESEQVYRESTRPALVAIAMRKASGWYDEAEAIDHLRSAAGDAEGLYREQRGKRISRKVRADVAAQLLARYMPQIDEIVANFE